MTSLGVPVVITSTPRAGWIPCAIRTSGVPADRCRVPADGRIAAPLTTEIVEVAGARTSARDAGANRYASLATGVPAVSDKVPADGRTVVPNRSVGVADVVASARVVGRTVVRSEACAPVIARLAAAGCTLVPTPTAGVPVEIASEAAAGLSVSRSVGVPGVNVSAAAATARYVPGAGLNHLSVSARIGKDLPCRAI